MLVCLVGHGESADLGRRCGGCYLCSIASLLRDLVSREKSLRREYPRMGSVGIEMRERCPLLGSGRRYRCDDESVRLPGQLLMVEDAWDVVEISEDGWFLVLGRRRVV